MIWSDIIWLIWSLPLFERLPGTGGPIFQNAVAALARLGCKDLYHRRMNDATRQAQLQRFILELRLNADEVCRLFNANGITCVALNSMTNLREANTSTSVRFAYNGDSNGRTHHFNTIQHHPIGGSVEMFSPCSLLSSQVSIAIMPPQPKYGEHSALILKTKLGFSDTEIEGFVQSGVVGTAWSKHYIPDGGTDLNPWDNVKNEYQVMMDRVKQLRIVDSKL